MFFGSSPRGGAFRQLLTLVKGLQASLQVLAHGPGLEWCEHQAALDYCSSCVRLPIRAHDAVTVLVGVEE